MDTVWQLVAKECCSDGLVSSTKAMEVPGGCIVQITTQQKNPNGSYSLAEAVCFVPGVSIETIFDAPDEDGSKAVKGRLFVDTAQKRYDDAMKRSSK